jgi:hypothetical protein
LQACLEGYTLSVAGLLGLGGRPDASQLIDGMQSIDHESGDKSGCEFMSQVRMKKILDVAIHCAISFKCIVQAVFEIPIQIHDHMIVQNSPSSTLPVQKRQQQASIQSP